MNSQQFIISTLDDDEIQLDYPLSKLQGNVEERIDLYSNKMAMMEANVVQQGTLKLLFKLLKVLLDPYLIILFLYLSIVFIQLVLLTRSSLQGRFHNVIDKPNRIKVLLFSACISLGATWYK